MNSKLKKTITGIGITAALVGSSMVGYNIGTSQSVETLQPKEIVYYTFTEKNLVIMLWNKMLEAKKANCEEEADCEIIDGKPNVIFEGINKENIGAKLDEKLGEYEIILKKKIIWNN